jgi:type II secretory pathway predicted ATPase ExeA
MKSNAERQSDHRARMILMGYTEVRGIYLPRMLHQALRERARRILAAHLRGFARWVKHLPHERG